MSRPRLAPGRGTSPRTMITVTDRQRQVLDALSARTGRSTAELIREALDGWLATMPPEELPQAS